MKLFFTILLFCQVSLFGSLCFDGKKIDIPNSEWKKKLSPERYAILREGKTEPPFENAYDAFYKKGIYVCAACQLPLFRSEAKYDSQTGWPSFFEPICPENVTLKKDNFLSLFLFGTEVLCSRCGSHLGHVFNDGPPPTGKRYCMNSLALIYQSQPLSNP